MKALDLNKAKKQTFTVIMMDDNKTVFNLVIPKTEVVKELKTLGEDISSALADNDKDAIDSCYEICAKLFSCNRMNKTVTAEKLKNTYRMELEDLVLFFTAYTEFLSEFTNAKN